MARTVQETFFILNLHGNHIIARIEIYILSHCWNKKLPAEHSRFGPIAKVWDVKRIKGMSFTTKT
jgi:hypothetical protein